MVKFELVYGGKALGQALQHLRMMEGLTQQQLADRAKIALRNVQRAEAGTQIKTALTLIELLSGEPVEILYRVPK